MHLSTDITGAADQVRALLAGGTTADLNELAAALRDPFLDQTLRSVALAACAQAGEEVALQLALGTPASDPELAGRLERLARLQSLAPSAELGRRLCGLVELLLEQQAPSASLLQPVRALVAGPADLVDPALWQRLAQTVPSMTPLAVRGLVRNAASLAVILELLAAVATNPALRRDCRAALEEEQGLRPLAARVLSRLARHPGWQAPRCTLTAARPDGDHEPH